MITVLLATYNGEKYLSEQIDSILRQTYSDFKIIIRDDGSSDATAEIIKKYSSENPDKISVVSGEPTKSACGNFAALFALADDDYIMFCDQDDVWHADKIEKTIGAMKRAEAEFGNIPILVHADLEVVDGNLSVISKSFFGFQAIDTARDSLANLLVQNVVTGCTVMVNRALKDVCKTIPGGCAMHDWWLALTAASLGKIVCVKEPLMCYRQHGDNQVGAKGYGPGMLRRKLHELSTMKKNYLITFKQAEMMLDQYGGRLDEAAQKTLRTYASLPTMSKLRRIYTERRCNFLKNTFLRRIGQYILM